MKRPEKKQPTITTPTDETPKPSRLNIEVPLDEVHGGRRGVCTSFCNVCQCWACSLVCQSR